MVLAAIVSSQGTRTKFAIYSATDTQHPTVDWWWVSHPWPWVLFFHHLEQTTPQVGISSYYLLH